MKNKHQMVAICEVPTMYCHSYCSSTFCDSKPRSGEAYNTFAVAIPQSDLRWLEHVRTRALQLSAERSAKSAMSCTLAFVYAMTCGILPSTTQVSAHLGYREGPPPFLVWPAKALHDYCRIHNWDQFIAHMICAYQRGPFRATAGPSNHICNLLLWIAFHRTYPGISTHPEGIYLPVYYS